MSDEVNPFSPEGRYTNHPNEPSPHPPQKPNVWLWVIALIFLMGVGSLACCGGLAFVGVKRGVAAIKAPIDVAVTALNEDPVVAGKLGTPINSSSTLGVEEYNNHNGDGGATVNFSATGPDGTAAVSGKMKLEGGNWSPESLTIEFSDGTQATIPAAQDPEVDPAQNP